jgi:hypothetical protein
VSEEQKTPKTIEQALEPTVTSPWLWLDHSLLYERSQLSVWHER